MRLSRQQSGIGNSETITIYRRPEVPTLELCRIASCNRRLCRFCTGLDIVVPQTWEGDVLYRRRRHRLAPGLALCAEPGLVLRFVEVRRAGDLSILTVDSEALIRLLVPHLPAVGSPIELSDAVGSLVSPWLARLQDRDTSFDALLASLGDLVERLSAGSGAPPPKVEVGLSPSGGAGSHPLDEVIRPRARDASSFQGDALTLFLECASCEGQAVSFAAMPLEHGSDRVFDRALGPAEAGSRISRRRFRARHGLPPHAYDLCRRIALAQQALRLGRTELTQVAIDYGFVDQSHFIRHFKRLVGVTPSQYRRCGPGVVAPGSLGAVARKVDQRVRNPLAATGESGVAVGDPTKDRIRLYGAK